MFHVKHFPDVPVVCRRHGLDLSVSQQEMLEMYVAALLEWNKKINLISRKDEENVWAGHILHSLSLLFRVRFPDRLRVLDLGSGGGLPGIPLAIVRSGWSVVLMDSIQKKCTAVEEIVNRLGLSERIKVVCSRAEEKGTVASMRGGYDLVLARGVAPMIQLVRWAKPYVRKVKGSGVVEDTVGMFTVTPPVLVAYKGGSVDGEIRELKIKAGVDVAAVVPLIFGGSEDTGLVEKKIIIVSP